MVVDVNGVPIEYLFTPRSTSDVTALKLFDYDEFIFLLQLIVQRSVL